MQNNKIENVNGKAIAKYMNKVVSIIVTYRGIPIKGKMISANQDFIELERLSGDITTIRLAAILGISEGRDARTVV
jgi:hypothetical protein